jgi:pimeloyl-ACP methyl ester carboxylesterase
MLAGPRLRDVTFSSGDAVLAGSLAVPGQDAASAGVVMVGGSGPSDRNNDMYFPPVRRHLVQAGIAVLSYDKRGVGSSSGDWRDSTIDDLSADAMAALDFLCGQPQVRADATGLFGHSEGGWVVLRAAANQDDVPWVITSSCPGTTLAAQERHALATALRQDSVQDVSRTLALYDQLVEAGRRDSDFAGAQRLIDSARPAPAFASYWSGVDERWWEFLKRNQDHDPIPDTLRLSCPHLAIFGGADERVPVPDSIRLFSTAACHPHRHRRAPLTIEVFPGASHRIQTDAGTRLATGYLDTLTQWIKARASVNADI